MKALAAVKETL